MSFPRTEIYVTPRALTKDEQARWPRKDGTSRECVVVYDLQTGAEIPASGATVRVSNREHQVTYARMERDGSISIGLPRQPRRATRKEED